MAEPRIKSPALLIRTALFIASIRQTSDAGHSQIAQAVAERAYFPFGLTPPSSEVVREYFTLRRTPAMDPPSKRSPSWLMAADFTYPGTAYFFFHPLADFLFGRIESTAKHTIQSERIPEEWIEDALKLGKLDEANGYIAHNLDLGAKRGRPRRQQQNRLGFLHMTMLRLRPPCRAALFLQDNFGRYRRRFRPVSEVEAELANTDLVDRTAALLGLFLEACELGDLKNRWQARRAARNSLRALLREDRTRRFRYKLRSVMLSSEGLRWPGVRDYSLPEAYRAGLPVSWAGLVSTLSEAD